MYTIIISEFVNLKNHILAERYLAREEAGGLPLLSLNAESDFFDAFGQTENFAHSPKQQARTFFFY